MRAEFVDDQTTVALLAHGMLTSLSVVRAALWLTASSEDRQTREEVMRHGMEQVTLINDTLVDLVRGLSPEAIDVLQEVRRVEWTSDGTLPVGPAEAETAAARLRDSVEHRVKSARPLT